MNALHYFQPEIWGFVSAAAMVAYTKASLSEVPRSVKWPHWLVLAIYYAVGLGAFRFLVRFCFNHGRFVGEFGGSNALEVTPMVMQFLALALGLGGTALLVAAIPLARFRRKSRVIFSLLVLPVSALYPLVAMTALGVTDVASGAKLARIAGLAFAGLAVFAILFYRSRYVAKHVQWT